MAFGRSGYIDGRPLSFVNSEKQCWVGCVSGGRPRSCFLSGAVCFLRKAAVEKRVISEEERRR